MDDHHGGTENLLYGLTELYPGREQAPLQGLYLCRDLRAQVDEGESLVYSNFITSLDGRIAVVEEGQCSVPKETANPRDWRLFLELAAAADALIVSGRYIRELGQGSAQALPPFHGGDVPDELWQFREDNELSEKPALVVVSRSLNFPLEPLQAERGRKIYIATTDDADEARRDRLQQAGMEVLLLGERAVQGARLRDAVLQRGMALQYSIAGPEVLYTLIADDVLDRLYITTALRILGGEDIATILRGGKLPNSLDFSLIGLYLDRHGPDGVTQLMQIYKR